MYCILFLYLTHIHGYLINKKVFFVVEAIFVDYKCFAEQKVRFLRHLFTEAPLYRM
jgi:hypothetical protein